MEANTLSRTDMPQTVNRSISAKTCGKASREHPDLGYSEERKEEIIKAYQERSSMRGVARTFGVSRNTLTKWLKKSSDTSAP